MTANSLTSTRGNQHLFDSENKRLDLEIARKEIYSFFTEIVKKCEPNDVLREFKRLFLDFPDGVSTSSPQKICPFFFEREEEFHHTLKRCCYILINNWETNRKYKSIHELVNLLSQYKDFINSSYSSKIKIYKGWVEKFINSEDYEQLKLFAFRNFEEQTNTNWVRRYSSYLLIAQSLDPRNPREQQEASIKLARQLKDRFKFDLAMYIARSQSRSSSSSRYKNPSILGDSALSLIKAIVVKKGIFSYENIANIFVKQTQHLTLQAFKESLQKYLIFSVQKPKFVATLKQQLSDKLNAWKVEQNEEVINKDLWLRTCNKVIDYLTIENGSEPASLFLLLLSQGHALTLVIVLLKIILISKNSRNHLESRIAHIIRYYNNYPEEDCKWLIYFIEIFHITLAIYAENVEYNLVKLKKCKQASELQENLEDYHVFSQLKMRKECRGVGGL